MRLGVGWALLGWLFLVGRSSLLGWYSVEEGLFRIVACREVVLGVCAGGEPAGATYCGGSGLVWPVTIGPVSL